VKNLIVVGDSFCAREGWPQKLASLMNLNLIVAGFPGQHWWSYRHFLDQNLKDNDLKNTEFVVFCHTFTERIPNLNSELGLINAFQKPHTELEQAVVLYYKYIENAPYAEWAQEKWFEEINQRYSGHFKTVHLHVTHTTWEIRNLLGGMQVHPNLTALSLDELGAKNHLLFDDVRANHFSQKNNIILAQQLAELMKDYAVTDRKLRIDEFELKSKKWTRKDLW